MLQGYSGYMLIASGTIVIMLLLFIDIMQKSFAMNQTKTNVENISGHEDHKRVYPFYVDCSRTADKYPSAYDNSTIIKPSSPL